MHVFIFVCLIVAIFLIVIHLQKTAHRPARQVLTKQPVSNRPFVFISKGKLFLRDKNNQVQELHSPYVQDVIDRMNRRKQLHGWKKNTALNTSFTGQAMDLSSDQVDLQVISAQFITEDKLIYFLRDNNVGGLFEYDRLTNIEKRLIHKQNLSYENLSVDDSGNKIICAEKHNNGISNIVQMNADGSDTKQLTEGDTVDSNPVWVSGKENKLLYQSAGIARNPEGYLIALGSSSISMLDIESNQVNTVLEDERTDFLQPRVDQQGNLYFIRRPYELPAYGTSNFLVDFILFPFRLVRAVFHYLNFFSLMYSRKPLTSASGPEVQADIKDILIKGKMIDAEKALKKEQRVNGIPSLVPNTWQLVKRTQNGGETVLATSVASFDITSDDVIVYSNGYAVFQLDLNNQSYVVLRDTLIADVISS